MPNSKSKAFAVWLNRISWLVGLAAKLAPANMRLWMVAFSTIAGGLVTLLDKCDHNEKPSAPSASVTQTPEPTPEPTQTPTPKPEPTLIAPQSVKANEYFRVELCNLPNTYNVSLYADSYRLAYFGFDRRCMFVMTRLTKSGSRKLIAIGPNDLRVETTVIVK